MLFYKENTHTTYKSPGEYLDEITLTIIDTTSGENVVLSNRIDNYESIRNAIITAIKNEEIANVQDVYDVISCCDNREERKQEMDNIRTQLGIALEKDGTVVLPNGVRIPRSIAAIFSNMDTLEAGKALVNFSQLLMRNPRAYAREALIDWISKNPSLTILPDGRILGFRGLRQDYTSIHKGYGIVNGVEYNDHLDNSVGNVIEFPAWLIDHNPEQPCSVGLHVGTWNYASGFGCGAWVSVAFSPADVVSPPRDAKESKIRVSRMEIIEAVDRDEMNKKFADNNKEV